MAPTRERPASRFLSTLIVGGGSVVTLLIGLVAQAIIAARFGAGSEVDAYFTALVIPSTLVSILLVSLSLIFIPVFIETREQDGVEEAWQVVSLLTSNLVVLLLILTLAFYLLAGPIIRLVGLGYDEPTRQLAVQLTRLLLPIILLNALWTIAASLLQAIERFGAAVAGLVLGNLVYLAVLYPLSASLGITGVALAMLLNHFFTLLGMLLGLRDRLSYWRPRLGFRQPRFRRLLRLWGVLFSTSVFRRLNPAIERALASQTGVGSVSYLSYGGQMVRAIDQVLLNSVATVLFPSMARDISTGQHRSAKESLMQTVRLNSFLVIPIVFGLAVVREPIVRLLLQRGAFLPENTAQVSLALLFYSGLLINSMVGTVTSKALYSLKAVWFLALMSLVNVGGLIILARLFIPVYGFLGIALANSVNLTWPWHLLYLRRRLGPLGLVSLAWSFARICALSAVMALAVLGVQRLLAPLAGPGREPLLLLAAVATGGLVYGGGSLLFRFPEAMLVWENLRRRLAP